MTKDQYTKSLAIAKFFGVAVHEVPGANVLTRQVLGTTDWRLWSPYENDADAFELIWIMNTKYVAELVLENPSLKDLPRDEFRRRVVENLHYYVEYRHD